MMEVLGEDRQRPVQKAKMEIGLKKSPDFDAIIAAEASNDRAAAAEEQGEEEEEAQGDS